MITAYGASDIRNFIFRPIAGMTHEANVLTKDMSNHLDYAGKFCWKDLCLLPVVNQQAAVNK